jgi:hypothetical protein
VNIEDTDVKKAAEDQLGKNPDEAVRENRVAEPADSSKLASPFTSTQRLSSEETRTQTASEHHRPESQAKKPATATAADDSFEPWEREFMEELLNDVKGHLGTCSLGLRIKTLLITLN